MRFNQFSYIQTSSAVQLEELAAVGFVLSENQSDKKNLETFVRKSFFLLENTDQLLCNLLADWKTDLLTFFQSDMELTSERFYHIALQLLGFIPGIDYTNLKDFLKTSHFPIVYGNLIDNLYQLLNTRTKSGNLLIEQLVSDGLIPENNRYHFFNGKSLATFSTSSLIREVVYVETSIDTNQTGHKDLIKVSIIRPQTEEKIPVILTNSPYHQGVNEKASDAALHKMETPLLEKEARTITVNASPRPNTSPTKSSAPISQPTEKLGHITSYSLNDYLLARGFASLHVSGIGTLGSTGHMTSGDYQQVRAYQSVIDWLNGRAVAYTDHSRQFQVIADWTNGKVATTGLSYLGTLSNALATTGVNGLEVIIAEAGISSWYDYYRENGLVTSPGGYPGEDLDSLTALTYSRNLQAGDALRHASLFTSKLAQETQALDRASGDYNQYWHDRNYLQFAEQVTCEVVFTHGLQDWNVKPIHVWNMFHALPHGLKKHLFLHQGAHVYMNNWQSIDFRESMNALLSQKLANYDNNYQLPTVIWQENTEKQAWTVLENFGSTNCQTSPLGTQVKSIPQAYPQQQFTSYCASFTSFQQDLWKGKANQLTIDIPVHQTMQINGRIRLSLKVKSSDTKGFLSAQVIDSSPNKRYTPIPAPLIRNSMDNGRFYAQEHLMELPFVETDQRLVTKGYINLQNRNQLLQIETVPADEWLTFDWELQPTIYTFAKGSTLRLILYTTDFEVTIRDNSEWILSIDLENSNIHLPIDTQKEA